VLYVDFSSIVFKLKSKRIWLKLKMDRSPTKKSLGPGPDRDPRKIKKSDPGPDPRKKIFRPGPGSGHARSTLMSYNTLPLLSIGSRAHKPD